MSRVCVMGAGSWGTALALVLAANGHEVALWGRDPGQVSRMRRERCNRRYLPDAELPVEVRPSSDLTACLDGAELAIVVVPSDAFAGHLARMRVIMDDRECRSPRTVVWATKGFDPDGGGLLGGVARAHLREDCELAVLSGPSFAREVAARLPTAVTLASPSEAVAARCAAYFHAPEFRVYTTDDVIGVQVGGAVKNALAIAAGVVDGLGFGANTRAALITRGLAELARLGVAMGGRAETFSGLAGLGDLLLTCTDDQSRNRRFGLMLARGMSHAEAVAEIGQVVEGASACRAVCRLAAELAIDMPVCRHVEQVIYEGQTPAAAVDSLLARQPRAEL